MSSFNSIKSVCQSPQPLCVKSKSLKHEAVFLIGFHLEIIFKFPINKLSKLLHGLWDLSFYLSNFDLKLLITRLYHCKVMLNLIFTRKLNMNSRDHHYLDCC